MKKLCAILISAIILMANIPTFAYQDSYVNVVVNGNAVSFPSFPFIRDGVTYVDAQTLASALGLRYEVFSDHESIIISSYKTSICYVPNDPHATVADLSGTSDQEYHYRILSAPGIYADGRLMVAVRDIADVFGYALSFKAEENTVYFGYSPQMISQAARENIASKAYYFQNQAEFQLPSGGSGYCWVCSYAMVLTNLRGMRITPNDVAAVNISQGANGNFCYHSLIVSRHGAKFVSALSAASPYYGGRDSLSGGTFIYNPQKEDAVVRAALKEALALHPEGVLVRYAAFPHTMVAVAVDGDTILFNDPAPISSSYSDTGYYHGVPFAKTCIPSRGLALSDITFIQALD